nr:putative ribonuclease H-like domain-containing protein [Tanacetum cinerariifolium]
MMNGNSSRVNIKQLCSRYNIHTVKRSSQNRRIRRRRYNLIPAESKFKNLMLNHQDKYMMKAQLLDYVFNLMNTKIYIDNESTICIIKNPVLHSKTKHIEIQHHFIRDAYEKKLFQVLKIYTDDNVADLLAKVFDVSSKELASPKQMALGKYESNPLIVDSVSLEKSNKECHRSTNSKIIPVE